MLAVSRRLSFMEARAAAWTIASAMPGMKPSNLSQVEQTLHLAECRRRRRGYLGDVALVRMSSGGATSARVEASTPQSRFIERRAPSNRTI